MKKARQDMKKRAYERILTDMKVSYFYGNELYHGTLKNFSENGMFINTRVCYPFDTSFEILIKLKDEVLKIPVKVSRIQKTEGYYDGMGVKLFNQPAQYLEFVTSFKAKELTIPLTISDEALKQTTKCQQKFHCLTNNGNMCLIDKPINGRGLFIEERSHNNENCPYLGSSDYAFICNCPTRYEIYMRYNM